MGRLQGRNALVTGGARGLGEAQCQALVREGARVVIADIDVAAGDALAARINGEGGHALALELDVTNESQWERVMQLATEELGALDILVNNAGIAALGSAEDTTLEDWRRVMAVNLDGVFLGTRAGIRAMKQRGGAIINISSIKGIIADTFTAAYDASKAGVRNFTKSAALHCAHSGYGIRVNSVHPSYIMTDMVKDAASTMPDPDGFMAELLAKHPMGRLCEPEDVANAVVYLASDESGYVNGSEIVVDGGYTAQ
ncbi:glucose 1-dehydrogenase [Algiphilus aromaticivorans]|jgi:NAD(P)-dependent dehydrogenase (short-subunit alcohol dehydrogenase family)|uniref:glucose 1-dehydrogenase n=1 Tax=Algiphilus aromaticivorans TaxID=382454 RepID=UPI0005C1A816|nr:glucose 1-dehydrogenase [Algiphilus aromaticivorans]